MQKAHGTRGIDLADILGFTIGFCFLPSSLCLMAVLLLTYFERPGRLEASESHKRSRAFALKPSAAPEPGPDRASSARLGGVARQEDTARNGAEPMFQSFSRPSVAQPRC